MTSEIKKGYRKLVLQLYLSSIFLGSSVFILNEFTDEFTYVGFLALGSSLPFFFAVLMLYISSKYRKLSKRMENDSELKANWSISDNDWNSYLDFFKTNQNNNKWTTGIAFVIAGILVSFFNIRPISYLEGGFLGLILALSASYLLHLFNSIQFNLKSSESRKVLVAKYGVIIGGMAHEWNTKDAKLHEIKWLNEEKRLLEFSYSTVSVSKNTGVNKNLKHAHIVVPEEHVDTANEWVATFI